MNIEKINTRKFYTIRGTGRGDVYKITHVDTVTNQAYIAGVNVKDYGYIDVEKLRVYSDRHIAEYTASLKRIISEFETWEKRTKKD